jgi:hypothetical protein
LIWNGPCQKIYTIILYWILNIINTVLWRQFSTALCQSTEQYYMLNGKTYSKAIQYIDMRTIKLKIDYNSSVRYNWKWNTKVRNSVTNGFTKCIVHVEQSKFTIKNSCLPEEALILNALIMVLTVSDVLAYIIMKDEIKYQDIFWSHPKGIKFRPGIGVNSWHYFKIICIAENCTWFFYFKHLLK